MKPFIAGKLEQQLFNRTGQWSVYLLLKQIVVGSNPYQIKQLITICGLTPMFGGKLKVVLQLLI